MYSAVAARLNLTFDVPRLVAELEACKDLPWVPEAFYGPGGSTLTVTEDWEVLPLRSRGGRVDDGTAGANSLEPYRDTPYMARTPYIGGLLASLDCPLRSVRLSALKPGTKIHEHSDPIDSLEKGGDIRLHVPIVTDDAVDFVLGGERLVWRPGELWYADFSKPHSVENRGSATRVHLLACVGASKSLLALFPAKYLEGRKVSNLAEQLDARRPELEMKFRVDAGDERLRRELGRLPDAIREQLGATLAHPMTTRYAAGRLTLETFGDRTFYLDLIEGNRFKVADLPAYLDFDVEGGRLRGAIFSIDFVHDLVSLPAAIG